MGKTYWIGLTITVAGIYLYRNWDSLPPFHLTDAIGFAFIGALLLWMFRKRSVGSEDAADRQGQG